MNVEVYWTAEDQTWIIFGLIAHIGEAVVDAHLKTDGLFDRRPSAARSIVFIVDAIKKAFLTYFKEFKFKIPLNFQKFTFELSQQLRADAEDVISILRQLKFDRSFCGVLKNNVGLQSII